MAAASEIALRLSSGFLIRWQFQDAHSVARQLQRFLTKQTLIPEARALMAEAKQTDRMEKIVSLCKRRGFIFQSSEIYGGINGFWGYGPLGAELKRNVKDAWGEAVTRDRDDVGGLEASIIMHPRIWEASGHT